MEVIRALLHTIDFRPRVPINWYPLTRRLSLATLRSAHGQGNTVFYSYNGATAQLAQQFPDRVDVEDYQNIFVELHTYCSPVSDIIQAFHRQHEHQTWFYGQSGPLLAAIMLDDMDIVKQLWPKIIEQEFWTLSRNLAAQAGSIEVMQFLLAQPGVHEWIENEVESVTEPEKMSTHN